MRTASASSSIHIRQLLFHTLGPIANDLIQKYRNEMSGAKIRKTTKEIGKVSYYYYFTRYLIRHSVILETGNKTVVIARDEAKTVYSKGFLTFPKPRQEHYKIDFFKSLPEKEQRYGVSYMRWGLWMNSKEGRLELAERYLANPNANLFVYIYDKKQMDAYSGIYNNSARKKMQKAKEAKQKQLAF